MIEIYCSQYPELPKIVIDINRFTAKKQNNNIPQSLTLKTLSLQDFVLQTQKDKLNQEYL